MSDHGALASWGEFLLFPFFPYRVEQFARRLAVFEHFGHNVYSDLRASQNKVFDDAFPVRFGQIALMIRVRRTRAAGISQNHHSPLFKNFDRKKAWTRQTCSN